MTEDRGAFKTKQHRLCPISENCDVPSMPWRESRARPGKYDRSFVHLLQQRILTNAEQRLRYGRTRPDSRRRTRPIHLHSSHRVPVLAPGPSPAKPAKAESSPEMLPGIRFLFA